VSLLRQIEVAVANGKTTPMACRENGITEQTYYRRELTHNVALSPFDAVLHWAETPRMLLIPNGLFGSARADHSQLHPLQGRHRCSHPG
jgi:hypothetical protein